jgi:uncharacterized protein DUF4189
MSFTSFRAPLAISAAGIAAAGAVLVALSPLAHADDQWGACAAPANGALARNAICLGGGIPYADQPWVEQRALALCNYLKDRQCTVVVSFTDCGAIAGNGSQWAGGRGPTQGDAEQDALRNINNGKIAQSACITPGLSPSDPTWITEVP